MESSARDRESTNEGTVIRGVKAARGSGDEIFPMRKPPNVVGQDHNFQRQASRLE